MEFAYCHKHQTVVLISFDGYTRKWISMSLLSECDCAWHTKPETVK